MLCLCFVAVNGVLRQVSCPTYFQYASTIYSHSQLQSVHLYDSDASGESCV